MIIATALMPPGLEEILHPQLIDMTCHPAGEALFRIETSNWHADGGSLRLLLRDFKIVRHTPKGVWIMTDYRKRFVLTSASRKWAYPTKGEALVSFQRRKEWQVAILRHQLEMAQAALDFSRLVTV